MKLISHAPIFIILFQLLTAVILPLINRWKERLTSVIIIISALINILISSLTLLQVVRKGSQTYRLGGWADYIGIEVIFDPLTGLMSLLISVVFLLIAYYALEEMKEEIDKSRFGFYFSLLFLLNAAMNGMIMAFDIFNLYVFIEVSLITSVAIISIKDTASSIESAFKYLIFSAIGSGCILLGIGMIYQITGYLNFNWIAHELDQALVNYPQVLTVAIGLFIAGFGIKIALFPFHVWLPDAHSTAPTPSSAILSGLLTKIYSIVLIRIVYMVLSPQIIEFIPLASILRILSALAILFGSFFAITQVDIKRMLAYSSISQVGYIILGLSLFTNYGLKGAILHVVNYAFMKTTLFLAAGNIIKQTGRKKMNTLEGIGQKMPLTLTAFTFASLAMVGIPPFSGFFSKWYLALGSLKADQPILLAVIIISSLLNAAYYFPIIIKAFFHQSQDKDVNEVKPALYLPVILLGTSCLLLGLGVEWSMKIINNAVNILLIGG